MGMAAWRAERAAERAASGADSGVEGGGGGRGSPVAGKQPKPALWGQGVHAEAPVKLLNVPLAQARQAWGPKLPGAALKVPGLQGVGRGVSPVQYAPAGHCTGEPDAQ